ncbi:hypothetical protein MKW98_006559 [Papaver atlanticum]|uniref:Uncharacterized protein n=1 Tax=Papaver atlanticum TaxID=357466 RepID=A0AAD4T9P5_9MAGN|nr:hypothetical protein MKW98_006559 [Papaver atlanticum]
MVLNGAAPPRGSAAAAAGLRIRRETSGGGATRGSGNSISRNIALVMSIGFIAFVALLHVFGKLLVIYSTRRHTEGKV